MKERTLFFIASCCLSLFFSATSFSAELSQQDPQLSLHSHKETLAPLIIQPSTKLRPSSNTTASKSYIIPDASNKPISSISELMTQSPGISQNGQGGHFQNFSIRGVSRQRVKILINGMRIETDRRAGVSASFLEPLLIEQAIVWRNPASTIFGSGALGGAVEIESKHINQPMFISGYESNGNENYQVLGVGDEHWSLAMARRDASNSRAADGSELNTHFTQYSATLSAQTEWQGLIFDFFALPAIARDIGKSNTDFPLKITNYPEEKHLLVKLGISSDTGWSGSFFMHPNDLETQVHKINSSLKTVNNEAFDLGFNWQYEQSIAGFYGTLGIDYFSRQAVNINENSLDLKNDSQITSSALTDGAENETAVFTTLSWAWQGLDIQAGSRFSYFQQTADNKSNRDDNAWSGFIGLAYPVNNKLEISANIATGFRFPSLSERFFSGTTGRGEVIGNPHLKKEQSINFDLGVSWEDSTIALSSNVFYLHVDDYIERVEIANNLLTFVNLSEGRIKGAELQFNYLLNEQLNLSWSGHLLDGKDKQGNTLADIPSNRMIWGINYHKNNWDIQGNYELRANKDNIGSGEKQISSAQLLSANMSYQLNPSLQLSVSGSNLLNEHYFSSADNKSSYAKGRSIGFNISWQMNH